MDIVDQSFTAKGGKVILSHKEHREHKESGGFPQTPKTFVDFVPLCGKKPEGLK